MQIFDSLGHASLTKNWLGKNLDATAKTYSEELDKNGFLGGLCVGLAHRNGYNHKDFLAATRPFKNLHPVAGFDPMLESSAQLTELKDLGYVAIKIHPRFSKIDLHRDLETLKDTFISCGQVGLPVMLCTYCSSTAEQFPSADPLYAIAQLVAANSATKVILVHGGGVDLLRYSELARFNSNVLLDLSFTILKFAGSSVDLDITYLLKNLDQRICIGSDFPEYTLADLKKRILSLTTNVAHDKVARITSQNIIDFLSLKI